jgi:hypothetical protein
MDEKRSSETGTRSEDESPAGASTKETAQSPQAGNQPTGQMPQGAGGQPEVTDNMTKPGQAGQGLGGPGDRTNLSGMGGPEKSNWNQDAGKGTEEHDQDEPAGEGL